jgi:hypothetical protein
MKDYPTLFKKQKSHRVAPMAFENKKAMGPNQSPMAFHPSYGNGFMGDPCQNKSKRNKNKKIDPSLSSLLTLI